jgi:hypothetical protein
VHEDGVQVERRPDDELQFRRPNGRVLANVPALPAVHDSERVLRGQNAGVELNARTLTPYWDGTGLNIAYAIDVLHPRAIGH